MGNCSSTPSSKPPPIPVPPGPRFLLEHRDDTTQSWYPAKDRAQDSPLATAYRIYAAILYGRDLALRSELEYFFRRAEWRVAAIPDPRDRDRERYAVLAGVMVLLAASFNRNIGLGQLRDAPPIMTDEEMEEQKARPKEWEVAPKWAAKVAPLQETLAIPDGEGKLPKDKEDERADKIMRELNVLTTTLPIYFI